ncbi:lipoprotein [Actinoallomurus bryophytorum]|uniref:LppX_LprAFG lipoprotein n=1 Tax=Actinoallomurus bryophytorum TaxID=1490222 RepID=A0A543CLS7_9ACTN|nr:hypothetical protein [Actinoallomurus bryophytorum]TQL98063.1 hypothetical protein FB559_3680 [Actinoallomurus bryophytorum]
MTPKAGRYVAGAAAGLAVALSLTACKGTADKAAAPGGDKPGGVHLPTAQDALAKVSSQTAGLKSFRATMSMSTGASGQQTRFTGKLAYRLKPTLAMKFVIPSMNVGGRTSPGISEILVGNELYMKMPALAARSGKPWVGLSFDKLKKSSGLDLKAMGDQGSQGDPTMNAKMLTASKDVRSVGTETVGGVSTTHYQGTFAMQDALTKLDGEQRAQAQKSLGQSGIDKMAFDIWVDGRQLPRKMSMATPPGAKPDMKMTMTYTAFNAPLSITAPPKSQVADGSDLMGGGGANQPA